MVKFNLKLYNTKWFVIKYKIYQYINIIKQYNGYNGSNKISKKLSCI